MDVCSRCGKKRTKEAIAVLAGVATADALPRLEALVASPHAMGPGDAIRALAEQLKGDGQEAAQDTPETQSK